jgi:anti-anti-sigma factor
MIRLRTKLEERDGVAVCRISGEVTIDTVPELKKTFKKIIDNKARKVLLGLAAVDYIDSAGLASLIELSRKLKAIQGIVFMSELSPKVSSIFSITKLDKIFRIFDTEEEALKNFYGY